MASVFKLLQSVEPKTRHYIRYYRISEIYESLICGLAIVRPDDCIEWLIKKLKLLESNGTLDLRWDLFIPVEQKIQQKPIDELSLSYIFSFLDDMQDPTAEQIEQAYIYKNRKLYRRVFYSLRRFNLVQNLNQARLKDAEKIAKDFHCQKMLDLHLKKWIAWVRTRKDRQTIAAAKLSRLLVMSHLKILIEQWHLAAKDARQTRQYFEKLEKGEGDADSYLYGNGESRDDLATIPRKLAIHILSFLSIEDLSRCSQVSRSWKMITGSNILWSKVDLSTIVDKLSDKLFAKMIKSCRPYLKQLNLRGAYRITQPSFSYISGCHNIQDLNLSECKNLTDEYVNLITIECRILLYLNLSYNTQITDVSGRYLSKNCRNLQNLSLSFCTKLTDKAFSYICTGGALKELIHLDLSGCYLISPTGYQNIAQTCTKLSNFIINGLSTSITDHHFVQCGRHLTRLTEVSLLNSPRLTDESFRHLLYAKHLRVFKINSNQNLTDTALKYLTKSCPDLRHVSMTDCEKISDGSLKALSGLKNLQVLNLADCIRITDTGIKYLTEGACSVKLRELNLANCICLGNMSMINLAKKCRNLAFLVLSFCEQIEEDSLELMGSLDNLVSVELSGCNLNDDCLKNFRFSSLKHCSFAGCSQITDSGFQKFVSQCPNLEILDISGCLLLGDNSVKFLAFSCKFLIKLDMSGCKMITDMAIQYLSGVCLYLSSLDLNGCTLITDKSLKYLNKGCKYMQRLSIMNCPSISKDLIDRMRGSIRHIEHFEIPTTSLDLMLDILR